mgnify:CR=1 FL=1
MKKLNRICISIISICMLILVIFITFDILCHSMPFFDKIWEKSGTFDALNIDKSELEKVIKHTIDYLNNKNDSLQIQVTLRDGSVIDFYQKFPFQYSGKDVDELAHMADCKPLFMGFRELALISLILIVLLSYPIIRNRKMINKKDINVIYYTYGAIFVIIGILLLLIATNFTKAFEIFHHIFFSKSNTSWEYPYNSRMIIMLPETIFYDFSFYMLLSILIFIIVVVVSTILIKRKLNKRVDN